MEKYSSGWRGAPAKGVGRLRGARVQIPPSPLHSELHHTVFFYAQKQLKMQKSFDFRQGIFSTERLENESLQKNKKTWKKVLTTSEKRDNIYLADAEKSQ